MESGNAERTRQLGYVLGQALQAGDWVGLIGEIGAGKTCFAQGVLAGLGVTVPVKSPTFSLVHSYAGTVTAHHLDLYRLSGPDDLDSIGYDDLTAGDAVVVVEWADRLGDRQPEDGLLIRFAVGGDGYRVLRLVPLGDRGHALAAAMTAAVGDES